MDLGIATAPGTINYMYIPDFGRYYWLTSPGWVWEDRLWVGYFTVDALASHKTGIGATSAYVARSASSYDGDIIDTLYPGKASPSFDTEISPNTILQQGISNGQFVVGIQGKEAASTGGAVTYYVMDNTALRALCHYMMDTQDYQVLDISPELLKCIFNPLQYISSCMWFPFTIYSGNSEQTVQFGWWTVTITSGFVKKLSGNDVKWTCPNETLDIPVHPQVSTRGNFLKANPFSEYYLSAGPFGIIPLSDAHALASGSVTFWINVDLITGTGRLEIKTPDSLTILSLASAQIGVPVQLGQNVLNQGAIESQIADTSNMFASARSLNPFGVASGTQSFIGDYLASKFPVISSLGSNGNMAFFNLFAVIAKFITVVDEDLADRGRPLMQVKTMNTLSGYIECINPDPQIACSDDELKTIVGYMTRGFFYE